MTREAEWTEPYSQRALIHLDADDRERAHHAGQHAARAREDEAPNTSPVTARSHRPSKHVATVVASTAMVSPPGL